MKKIALTQNQVALVDDEYYERLDRHKWCANKKGNTFYAVRGSSRINGKQHTIFMHHEIIGKPPKGFINDHRDGDGLNNRRNNLRHVTKRQNAQNQQNRKQSSQYPGVFWDKKDKKWKTQIWINGKRKRFGGFVSELEASEAYKQAVNDIGEEMIDTGASR